MAKLVVKKEKLAVLNRYLVEHKINADYGVGGSYKGQGSGVEIIVPNGDLGLGHAIEIDNRSADIYNYPIYFEVAISDLDQDVPAGLTWSTKFDDTDPENPVEVNTKWSDLTEVHRNATNTLRYLYQINSGRFMYEDMNLLSDYGYTGIPRGDYDIKINQEYSDVNDPEYVAMVTIKSIANKWNTSAFFDWLDAHLTMGELYEARGATDNDRWATCDEEEKSILVKWHVVGLSRAAEVHAGLSEVQIMKRAIRDYIEMDRNILVCFESRFKDWNRAVKTLLSSSGKAKFYLDYEAIMMQGYIYDYRRVNVGSPDSLIEFNDSITTWDAADFFGTVTPVTISGLLNKILTNKRY